MARTEVRFYQEGGRASVLEWLRQTRGRDPVLYARVAARLALLAECGRELGAPLAAYVRRGVWELRLRRGTHTQRILYVHTAQHGRSVALLVQVCARLGPAVLRQVQHAQLTTAEAGCTHEDQHLPCAQARDGVAMQAREMKGDAELQDLVEEARLHAHVARLVYRARTAAGYTQVQLAALVGTKQPGIARLEDADYWGRSLSSLRRIASVLGQRLDLRLLPWGQDQECAPLELGADPKLPDAERGPYGVPYGVPARPQRQGAAPPRRQRSPGR